MLGALNWEFWSNLYKKVHEMYGRILSYFLKGLK